MKRGFRWRGTACVAALAVGLSGGFAAVAQGAEDETPKTLGEALGQGDFGIDLRYRFETVDDDDFDKDGLASTLRTAVHYRSLPWGGVSVFFEAENVADVGFGSDHKDAGRGNRGNGIIDHPVIADPSGTDVNQVYLDFGVAPSTSIKIGRQEILLGNVRHVGNVGWRQDHQSFDAASLTTTAIPHTVLTYAYVDKVQRIFGDSVAMGSHLAQADVKIGSVGTVSAYGFLLDYDEEALAGLSTRTLGLRFDGGRAVGTNTTFLWDFEFADQSDAGDNPSRVDAGYRRGGLGLAVAGWTFKLSREILEGDPEHGRFTTPLATLHAWNGWADQFLSTPADGLEDTWLSASTKVGGVALTGVYHAFQANSGDADYGTEVDLHAVYVTSWKQKIGLKVAAYDADEYSRDVTKTMLWTSWSF